MRPPRVRDILDGHVSRGFARLAESALSRVLALKGVAEPETTEADVHRRADLQMARMAAADPTLTDVQVANRVREAF